MEKEKWEMQWERKTTSENIGGLDSHILQIINLTELHMMLLTFRTATFPLALGLAALINMNEQNTFHSKASTTTGSQRIHS